MLLSRALDANRATEYLPKPVRIRRARVKAARGHAIDPIIWFACTEHAVVHLDAFADDATAHARNRFLGPPALRRVEHIIHAVPSLESVDRCHLNPSKAVRSGRLSAPLTLIASFEAASPRRA